MRNFRNLLALALLVTTSLEATAAPVFPTRPGRESNNANTTRLRVLTYNVQNLFDTEDDPSTSDDDFTPKGAQVWTERVLRDKIMNIGRVILESEADVVGLVEIENEAILKRLVSEGLKNAFPHMVLAATKDPRGIRTALISKHPIVSSQSHAMDRGPLNGRGTRDILEVALRLPNGAQVAAFVNHWPARSNEPTRPAQRTEAAKILSERMTATLRSNARALAVAMGDFNDELGDVPFERGMRLVDKIDDLVTGGLGSFFALDSELLSLKPEERGTHYFHPEKSWSTLDHMLVGAGSDAARNPLSARIKYKGGSIQVYRHSLVPTTGIPEGCEILGARGGRAPSNPRAACPKGSSDHLPVYADFEFVR